MNSRAGKTSLEYDAAAHLHCRITLASGRSVVLESLTQAQTYAGWLEGLPRAEINDRIVEAALPPSAALIKPLRRDFLREPGDSQDPSGHVEWLPAMTCTARLTSTESARGGAAQGSSLTVVWYQDEFALPIASDVLARIIELDWNALASDQEDD